MAEEERYYYAGGVRVPLTPDPEYVAVDFDRLEGEEVDAPIRERLQKSARSLRGSLGLLDRSELPEAVEEQLERSGALQPVYRHEDTLLVVLPEVRVETAEGEAGETLLEYLEARQLSVYVEREKRGRLVLRPTSGRGEDALLIANRLKEEMHAEMAQARFVRLVPRP